MGFFYYIGIDMIHERAMNFTTRMHRRIFQVLICEVDSAYSNIPKTVAVRSASKSSSASSSPSSTNSASSCSFRQNKDDFLRECRLLSTLHHPNLIRLVGVITEADDDDEEDQHKSPYCAVLEHSLQGDLCTFLRGLEQQQQQNPQVYRRLLTMCAQVAAGMKYLENKNIVHRDLAAR
jgi:serine/threonine protein kinase